MYVHNHLGTATTHHVDAVLTSYKTEFNVRVDVYSSILTQYESEVVVSRCTPRRNVITPSGTKVSKNVRANYGIIRVMQSCPK